MKVKLLLEIHNGDGNNIPAQVKVVAVGEEAVASFPRLQWKPCWVVYQEEVIEVPPPAPPPAPAPAPAPADSPFTPACCGDIHCYGTHCIYTPQE